MYQWESNNANATAAKEGNATNTSGGSHSKQKKAAHNQTNTTFHASESFPTTFNSIPTGMIRPSTVEVLKAKMGFTALLPAQARCFNHIFKGSDTVLHSRTGTGKTLAFLLPLIERHVGDVERIREDRKGPWMVILLPTVELAAQTQRVISEVFYPSASAAAAENSKKNAAAAAASAAAVVATPAAPVATKKNANKKNAKESEKQQQQQNEDAAAAPVVQVSSISSSSSSTSIRGVRCLVAGLDATTEDDVMNRCDILVGTVHAVDALLRYRVDAQGNKVSTTEGNDNDNDDDDDEDTDSDDDEDLHAVQNAKQITSSKNKNNNDNKSRIRSRGDASDANGKKQPNNSANTTSKKFGKNKTKYVASPAAKYIRCVVIDEVDHTLGPKFSSSARRVHSMLKSIKSGSTYFSNGTGMQFVLVGATIPDWIQRVGFLGDPNRRVTFRLVSAGTSKLPDGLTCFAVECAREQDDRVSMTCRLLKQLVGKRVVVFAPTKLVELIAASKFGSASSKISIRRLDSSADDVERLRIINEFNDGVANVLVCTDRASRGLDFTNIDTVISTSFPPPAPTSAETFVHRAGRAGRAGKSGNCITLVDVTHSGEMQSKKMIESSAHIVFRPFEVTVGASDVEIAVSGKFSHNNTNNNNSNNNNNQSKTAAAASSSSTSQQKNKKQNNVNSNTAADVVCVLKVKNPFKVGGNNSNNNNKNNNNNRPARTAKQVLETTVGADLLKKIYVLSNDNGVDAAVSNTSSDEVVRFKVSKLLVEDIRSALWKYDITIEGQ